MSQTETAFVDYGLKIASLGPESPTGEESAPGLVGILSNTTDQGPFVAHQPTAPSYSNTSSIQPDGAVVEVPRERCPSRSPSPAARHSWSVGPVRLHVWRAWAPHLHLPLPREWPRVRAGAQLPAVPRLKRWADVVGLNAHCRCDLGPSRDRQAGCDDARLPLRRKRRGVSHRTVQAMDDDGVTISIRAALTGRGCRVSHRWSGG